MAIKVGFIGCGSINNDHMRSIAANPDADVVAVCDIEQERADKAAAEYDAEAFTAYETMIGEAELDAVYVGVPPFAHEQQETMAAAAGLHLFVEKPVALDMDTARANEQAIKEAGIISTAGFQDRYLAVIARMKQVLADNKPGLMMGYWMGGIPMVPWWRVKAQSGGQAVEQTIHIFDAARYLFGEIEIVHAVGSRGLVTELENYDIEDASAVNLKFVSGLCGTIFSSCFAGANNKSGIDVWCRELSLKYSERRSLNIIHANGDAEFMTVKVDPLAELDNTFIAAIAKNDQSLLKSDYADAVKSLEVVLAANQSMDTGEAVSLK